MPLYDLECTRCEHTYEIIMPLSSQQEIHDGTQKLPCPMCYQSLMRVKTSPRPFIQRTNLRIASKKMREKM